MHQQFFSRTTKQLQSWTESILLNFLYFSSLGKFFLSLIRTRLFSACMGTIFQAHWSRILLPFLIKKYHIDTSTYITPSEWFMSVQDFFIRKSKTGSRTFSPENNILCSPVDGCLEVTQNISQAWPCMVKWTLTDLKKLFGPDMADFSGGDLLFFRLRFSDYHRFHFFDNGEVLSSQARDGLLYSVDNTVLKTGLWLENKSHLMRLRTENFGEILWLEVGATNVGSITNHLWVGEQFSRGQEKWYFWLGGSAVLVLFQQNKISLADDITTMSKQWIETEVVTGESIGKSL